MADGARPNIVVIWGDDIGITNLSCYGDVTDFLATFQEFPPRQKPGSFSVGEAMEMLMKGKGNN
jgi:hypothetical protein